MIIYSDRDVFVGAHVTQPVKDALREVAKERDVSVSAFVADAILEKLRHCGKPLDGEIKVAVVKVKEQVFDNEAARERLRQRFPLVESKQESV